MRNKATIKIKFIFVILIVIATFLTWLLWFPDIANKDTKRVILISIDTLRADYLGCYGCRDKLTPALDEFAGESILF